MTKTTQKNYVQVPKNEYLYLKQLQKNCGNFWDYIKHLKDIEDARKEIKEKKIAPQRMVFKKLGI